MNAQANTTVSDDVVIQILEKIACRHVTEQPLWWQLEARTALTELSARRATADVTEAEVERAAVAIDALWSEDGTARSYPFPDTETSYQEHCRSTARAALLAAQQAPE